MEKLTDQNIMPFGKFKGDRMECVPASYLLWLYENHKCNKLVKEYVIENMEIILLEIKEQFIIKQILLDKTKAVINSCKTAEQMESALNYSARYCLTTNFHRAFEIKKIFQIKCEQIMIDELPELKELYIES